MYYITSRKEIIRSIHQATKLKTPLSSLTDSLLKNAYHHFLTTYSIFDSPIMWDTTQIMDMDAMRQSLPNYYLEKAKLFSVNSPLLTERLRNGFFTDGWLQLKNLHVDIYDLAQVIIKIILINQLISYTNGTTDKTIGFAIMDFKDHFQQYDFIELIVHQLIHMTLFIDNHADPHLDKHNKEVMIDTALKYKLGGNQFPVYLAFHSYIVGVEILAFRKEIGCFNCKTAYHASSDRMTHICYLFQKSLMQHIELFTPRGKYLLEKAFVLLGAKTT